MLSPLRGAGLRPRKVTTVNRCTRSTDVMDGVLGMLSVSSSCKYSSCGRAITLCRVNAKRKKETQN